MRESAIEKHLVAAVEAAGGVTRKLQWICRRGAPDRLIVLNGNVAFVEVKAPGEIPAGHQDREHKRLREAGAIVLVIDSTLAADLIVETFKGSRAWNG